MEIVNDIENLFISAKQSLSMMMNLQGDNSQVTEDQCKGPIHLTI